MNLNKEIANTVKCVGNYEKRFNESGLSEIMEKVVALSSKRLTKKVKAEIAELLDAIKAKKPSVKTDYDKYRYFTDYVNFSINFVELALR